MRLQLQRCVCVYTVCHGRHTTLNMEDALRAKSLKSVELVLLLVLQLLLSLLVLRKVLDDQQPFFHEQFCVASNSAFSWTTSSLSKNPLGLSCEGAIKSCSSPTNNPIAFSNPATTEVPERCVPKTTTWFPSPIFSIGSSDVLEVVLLMMFVMMEDIAGFDAERFDNNPCKSFCVCSFSKPSMGARLIIIQLGVTFSTWTENTNRRAPTSPTNAAQPVSLFIIVLGMRYWGRKHLSQHRVGACESVGGEAGPLQSRGLFRRLERYVIRKTIILFPTTISFRHLKDTINKNTPCCEQVLLWLWMCCRKVNFVVIEDCSGFVSMSWNLSSSYVTWTLPDVSHKVIQRDWEEREREGARKTKRKRKR